jgi:hypothetical protein
VGGLFDPGLLGSCDRIIGREAVAVTRVILDVATFVVWGGSVTSFRVWSGRT